MESYGQRFSVISRTSKAEAENRTPLAPYQSVSVIKEPVQPWFKSVRRSNHPKHIIVLEGNSGCTLFRIYFTLIIHLIQFSISQVIPLRTNVQFVPRHLDPSPIAVITNIVATKVKNHLLA